MIINGLYSVPTMGKNYVMIKLCYDQNIFIVWFQNLWENMKSIRAKNVLIFYSIIVFPSLQFYIKTKRYPLSNSTVSNVCMKIHWLLSIMLEFNLFPFISCSLNATQYFMKLYFGWSDLIPLDYINDKFVLTEDSTTK